MGEGCERLLGRVPGHIDPPKKFETFLGHFPTRAYLARLHCLTEQQTSQCRFGCPKNETRDYLLSCPHLATFRHANHLYCEPWPPEPAGSPC